MDSLSRMGLMVATASLSVLFGCTTGLVSSPLSPSKDGDPPSEGLVYHLRQSTIKVDATYRLTRCGEKPTFELRGLTISSGSTKDPQLGATFVIDTAELASGSKVTNAIINTSNGLIKDVSYDAVDKTGEIIKELAKIPVSVATAFARPQAAIIEIESAKCNQRASAGLTRYNDNENLLEKISGLIKLAISGSLEASEVSKDARKTADDQYRKALEAVQTGIQGSLKNAAEKGGKDYTDMVAVALTSLDTIRKNLASRTPETDSLFQTGSSETVKLVESLRSLASSIATDNEKLDQELSVVASGSLIPTYAQISNKRLLPIDFDLSGLSKLVASYSPADLGNLGNVVLSFDSCEPTNNTPPICKLWPDNAQTTGYQCKIDEASVGSPAADGGGGENAPTRSKFYGLYYRIPAVCQMAVSVNDKKYPLHNVELMQVGRLARLQLKNGPFQDSIQSVSFDENGSVAEYKQQVRSSATGSAVTSTADAIDTISQTKQKKIDSRTKELKAEKDLADAQKDLYESQKKRDDALDALKKN